jgi:tetratricopeptide (TPR) repeat protein
LPRAQDLRASGQTDTALTVLEEGLTLFPNDGGLLAQRSLAKLSQARGSPGDAKAAEALKDAVASVAAGAGAEGHYAAGRVAEETGNAAEAQQHYRKALESKPADDAAANRYRLALARVLLKGATTRPPTPESAPPARQSARSHFDTSLFAGILVLLQVPADPAAPSATPAIDEAIKLADQAIAARNYEGYLIKARALAQKGLWTEALVQYVEGLKRLIPADYAEGLHQIVDNHPAFKRLDRLATAEPVVAELHYGSGLVHYYAERYAEAEKAFLEAARAHDQDARYLYFLGLARMHQGKRDLAYEDFRLAARLEQEHRPSREAVSTALERVQGPSRAALNQFRP